MLGRGGMSVVYLAEHLGLKRKVALKLLAPQLAEDPRFRDRFVRESQVAASIDHPNVIPIYEAGQEEGVLFIAMRYVEGTDLRALLQAEGRLDEMRAVSFVQQIADALDAAHGRGLVHRDVKPGNVLIAKTAGSEAGEHVYLSDFGLTKRAASDSGITGTGQFVGTLDYAAPEQFEGKILDARTDIYSLGCLLYECLAGHAPFRRESDAAVMYAHLLEDPPPLTEQRPGLPEEIDAVIARAMAKKPELRYQAAGGLAAAARDALGVQPAAAVVAAPTPSPPRRRTALIAAMATIVVLAAIAFAVTRPGGSTSSVPRSPAAAGPPLGSLVEIDPSTGKLTETFSGLALELFGGAFKARVAAGEGGLWVAAGRGVTRVDPATGSIGARTPFQLATLGVVHDVAVGLGVLVVTDAVAHGPATTGAISRIDPATGRLRTVELPVNGLPTALAIGAGGIWETFGSGTLLRIDPRTFRVRDRFDLGGSLDALAVTDDAVWVGDSLASTVRRIDPRTGATSEPVHLGGGVDGLAAEGDLVWVLEAGAGTVTPVDATTGGGQPIRVGDGPTDIVSAFDAIWVCDEGGVVWRIDPVTNERTEIEVGAPLVALAADRQHGTLWVLVAEH